jgi:hypothetical protein
MSIVASIRCPSCHGALVPVKLRCEACDLTVSGRFVNNEFASLSEEDLHFLRIFVLCEGRIRDMESALGVSYPTIKGRLAQLKASLAAGVAKADAAPAAPTSENAAILKELEAGRLSFDEAMSRMKQQGES